MPPFHRILARVDADREPRALSDQLGALINGAPGVAVELVHVVDPIPWYARPFLPDADQLERIRIEHWERRLDALAASLRRPGVDISARVAFGRASVEFVQAATRGDCDLVMVETPLPTTGPTPSRDVQTLRDVPCPVWLARPIPLPIRHVVASIDPRPDARDVDPLHLDPPTDPIREALVRQILDSAAAVAASLGAELHVVHAWSAPGEDLLRGETLLSPDQVLEYVEGARRARRSAFDRALAQAGLDISPSRRHFVKGPAEEVIFERVGTLGAGLLVMGTVARGGLEALLGSTAETVLRHAQCSLLALKPVGPSAPAVEGPGSGR